MVEDELTLSNAARIAEALKCTREAAHHTAMLLNHLDPSSTAYNEVNEADSILVDVENHLEAAQKGVT